jgi:hypothetical protein
MGTVHPVLDPRLACFLLRERARPIARSHRAQERAAVAPSEVIALAAATVVHDRLAAVGIADRVTAFRDLPDRHIPVDLLEAAVGPSSQRRGQAVASILVVVQSHRLVARVAQRARVLPVAADPRELPPIKLDLDTAVALAQDARRFGPHGLAGTHAAPFNGCRTWRDRAPGRNSGHRHYVRVVACSASAAISARAA